MGEDFRVTKVVEKPRQLTTDLTIIPVYVFTPEIFRALEVTSPGIGREIQLTDGIQKLID